MYIYIHMCVYIPLVENPKGHGRSVSELKFVYSS
jgi:hypothetical protein